MSLIKVRHKLTAGENAEIKIEYSDRFSLGKRIIRNIDRPIHSFLRKLFHTGVISIVWFGFIYGILKWKIYVARLKFTRFMRPTVLKRFSTHDGACTQVLLRTDMLPEDGRILCQRCKDEHVRRITLSAVSYCYIFSACKTSGIRKFLPCHPRCQSHTAMRSRHSAQTNSTWLTLPINEVNAIVKPSRQGPGRKRLSIAPI